MFATQRHGVFAPKIQLKRENLTNAVKLEKCLRYSSIGRCDENGAEKVETHGEKSRKKLHQIYLSDSLHSQGVGVKLDRQQQKET